MTGSIASSPTALQREVRRLQEVLKVQQEQTAMLIHDFKGPLGEIVANLDLLASGKLSPEPRDYVETAQQACNTLLQMVSNLLDIHRMEEGRLLIRPSEFNLREAIERCITSLQKTAAAKDVRLEFDGDGKAVPVTADCLLLERVALNLMMNSLEFSPEGGVITVQLLPAPAGDQVVLTVSDQGRGIPPQYQEMIFNKFAQVERDGKKRRLSAGLGLAFCKTAVEAHGGRIWVRSRDHRGSTFGVELPVGASPRPES